MKKLLEKSETKQKAGFAVLFSVMLASFLITLGISIFSISLKEVQITTSIRDSQVAYYAADSARECALYWDIKQGAFPACLDDTCTGPDYPATVSSNVTCNGSAISLPFVKNGLTYKTRSADGTSDIFSNFFSSTTDETLPASDIRITKTWNPTNQNVVTILEAWGHNTGIIGRRVERGIQQINNF